jgi:hypothetical protein
MKQIGFFLFVPLFLAGSLAAQVPAPLAYKVMMFKSQVGTFHIGMEGSRMSSISGIKVGNIVSLTQWLDIDFDRRIGGIQKEEARNLFNGKMQTCSMVRKGDEVFLHWTPSDKRETRKVPAGQPFYTLNSFLKYLYDDAVVPGKTYPVLLEPRMLYLTKSNTSATNYRLRASDNSVNVDVTYRKQKDGTHLPLRILVSRYIYLGFNWSVLKLRMELDQ